MGPATLIGLTVIFLAVVAIMFWGGIGALIQVSRYIWHVLMDM